jgi:hypothetical protein
VVGISRSTGGGNYQGQVVGISRSIGGGNYQGQVVGEIIKVKWWGYQGQLVGEIIKVKWWGYLGQVVGISRPSGGDIKVRGRGLEVKVKKKWWGGACPLQLPLLTVLEKIVFVFRGKIRVLLALSNEFLIETVMHQ